MPADEEFSFRDIIKPGAGAEVAIRKQVENLAAGEQMVPGQWYSGQGEMLKAHGAYFPGRILPDEYKDATGEGGRCHLNTLLACEMHPELRLFTGLYAVGLRICSHSWAIAPDGGVVEVTYPTEAEPGSATFDLDAHDQPYKTGVGYQPPPLWAYWGLEFEVGFVRAWHDTAGILPILDMEEHAPGVISRKPFMKPYKVSGFALPTEEDMAAYEVWSASSYIGFGDPPDDDDGWEDDDDEA